MNEHQKQFNALLRENCQQCRRARFFTTDTGSPEYFCELSPHTFIITEVPPYYPCSSFYGENPQQKKNFERGFCKKMAELEMKAHGTFCGEEIYNLKKV